MREKWPATRRTPFRFRVRALFFLTLVSVCTPIWTCKAGKTFAQPIVRDPIRDYLDLPDKEAGNRTEYVKHLTDILELRSDIGGRHFVFLSTTGYNDRSGNWWKVYESTANGYRRLTRQIQFRPDAVYVGQVPELHFDGILTYNPATQSQGELVGYALKQGEFQRRTIRAIDLGRKKQDRELASKYLFSMDPEKPKTPQHPLTQISVEELRAKGYDIPK